MYMSEFTVTPNSLRALQRSLLGLAADLSNGDVSQSSYYDLNQDGAVNDADQIMSDFFLNWSASLEVTGQNIESVADKLGKAADAYQKTDNSCIPPSTTGGPVSV